jgi:hypothetical protein
MGSWAESSSRSPRTSSSLGRGVVSLRGLVQCWREEMHVNDARSQAAVRANEFYIRTSIELRWRIDSARPPRLESYVHAILLQASCQASTWRGCGGRCANRTAKRCLHVSPTALSQPPNRYDQSSSTGKKSAAFAEAPSTHLGPVQNHKNARRLVFAPLLTHHGLVHCRLQQVQYRPLQSRSGAGDLRQPLPTLG